MTVHRFDGKYLCCDRERALVYVQVGQDKAEIQSRPLASAIPAADVNAKSDVKRIEVPAGETVAHNGKVFLCTARELLVVDAECRIDWRFVLPGKADNGEQLLGVVGFDDGKVFLVSRNEPKSPSEKTGHVYTLDVTTGRQTGFATLRGGFGDQPKFSSKADIIFAANTTGVIRYNVTEQRQTWATKTVSVGPHQAAGYDFLFTTMANGFGAVYEVGGDVFLAPSTVTVTAPATPFFIDATQDHGLLVPTSGGLNSYSLVLLKHRNLTNRSQVWKLPVKDAITAAPVIHGGNVYFVSGKVVYRVSAATGAVCWKQTVSLNANESLTGLALVDGELRVSGSGVLVRVAERVDPQPRQIFFGGFGTWGSR